jgi:transposase
MLLTTSNRTSNMTILKSVEASGVICSTEKRKRWTPIEKKQIVEETYQAGVTVSYIARKHGMQPSQLFYWRKMMEMGALASMKAEEAVVPISEVNALRRRIQQLERTLGQKTLDNEILKEALKIGREKKLISRQPLLGLEDTE